MPSYFKDGKISKDGKSLAVDKSKTAFASEGQNTASAEAPSWVTESPLYQSMKGTAQDIYDGITSGGDNLVGDVRSKFLKGGDPALGTAPTTAYWGQSTVEDRDWRVKLSLPSVFERSELMKPLINTGGMMFPYTPTIILSHSANYNQVAPIHNNYPFFAYQNSQVDQLVITGQFYSQNGLEASYWVACLHYLRTVTKMQHGSDQDGRGNPPPVVELSGYGDYVFNKVPVIIANFTVDMPNEVDYIATGFNPIDFSDFGASIAEQKAGMSVGWAPSESQFTVTVQPIYSRSKVSKFSYSDFVNGSNLGKGYI